MSLYVPYESTTHLCVRSDAEDLKSNLVNLLYAVCYRPRLALYKANNEHSKNYLTY